MARGSALGNASVTTITCNKIYFNISFLRMSYEHCLQKFNFLSFTHNMSLLFIFNVVQDDIIKTLKWKWVPVLLLKRKIVVFLFINPNTYGGFIATQCKRNIKHFVVKGWSFCTDLRLFPVGLHVQDITDNFLYQFYWGWRFLSCPYWSIANLPVGFLLGLWK